MAESAASRAGRVEHRGRTFAFRGVREIHDGGSTIIPRAPQVFSHFTEKAIDATNAPFILHETHTTTASTFAIVTPGSGVLGGQAAAATDPTAVAADAWTVAFGGLLWECDTTALGGCNMFVEARMKFADTAASEFFFGFADATNAASDIDYAFGVTDSAISTSAPNDAFGFVTSGTATGGDLDSSSSTVVLGGISSIGGTDTLFVPGVTAAYKGTAPVQGGSGGLTYPSSAIVVTDSVFYTLRVELDLNGNGLLFKDHKFFASFPAAVTKTVPLAAIVNGIARSTAQMKVTFDYVAVGGCIPLTG